MEESITADTPYFGSFVFSSSVPSSMTMIIGILKYINFYQAKAITEYRRLKGPLHSLTDLSLLPEFPARELERLMPYVEF